MVDVVSARACIDGCKPGRSSHRFRLHVVGVPFLVAD